MPVPQLHSPMWMINIQLYFPIPDAGKVNFLVHAIHLYGSL